MCKRVWLHARFKRRQAEGIAAARQRGVRFGRNPLPLPDDFPEIYKKWTVQKLSYQKAMEILHITQGQFYAYVKKYRTELSAESAGKTHP